MTLHMTEWLMISDRTPEQAFRIPGAHEQCWRLSWLPDRPLTAAQARAGMELDELLSDPSGVDHQEMLDMIETRARLSGIAYADAVVALVRRSAARTRRHLGGRTAREAGEVAASPAPGPRA
ncbi:hypothetical protein [Nocardia pseudobrasiliensis]|uniref:Uncharacterized protein n=1 Tax=Nocardia pseudobrasiliensis TaxID=45979 RepID=A0A370HZQ2_9NOCA|nr:hypothetical protein [Nocardia pseudobrasiliensis]RDI63421.1 hypothetical protein DFR76_110118 [Nocardia pseudobrasiliensis]